MPWTNKSLTVEWEHFVSKLAPAQKETWTAVVSGTEPVNVLSQYKFQDGLYYYESTRDTASHLFIDYLPKGVYVFKYSVRVQLKGQYQTGFAAIQCMYAPEFNSHSASLELEVK